MRVFWDRAQAGGRKSFRYEELDQGFLLHSSAGILVPYLEAIQRDLDLREES